MLIKLINVYLYKQNNKNLENMSKEVKLSSGHEDRVLSVKKEGSSFKVKVESFWKGEESGELHFSNHNWFNSLEECERDMDLLSSELESLGFKKS